MSIVVLTADAFESLSLTAHPYRTFSSSSDGTISGSVHIFAQRSDIEKEAQPFSTFDDSNFSDSSIEDLRHSLVLSASTGTGQDMSGEIDEYLNAVNKLTVSTRKQKSVQVTRFEPSVKFTADTQRKNVVRKILYPYYRPRYHSLQWAYTNYNTLNFFTSSQVPSDSVMMYPAISSSLTGETTYRPTGPFSFDFYINPRYTTDHASQEYHAGTIYHMSSSYALSLVSGSNKGLNGSPSAFRIMLQLSHSAEVLPSEIALTASNNSYLKDDYYPSVGSGKGDLIFLSSDNSLKKNHWHHVSIRWGTDKINSGKGSIVIDGEIDSTFLIPSSTVIPASFNDPQGDPDALFIGNFYQGRNNTVGTQNLVLGFFNDTAASNEGVTAHGTGLDEPTEFSFTHPLNAEVHDLKIYSSFRSLQEIQSGSIKGPSSIEEDLEFYVPPFFTKESRIREVMQTPFHTIKDKTDDPYNVALSLGVGGHLLNLENFTREFVKKEYPRLYALTASTIDVQTETALEADQFLFATASIRKRNLSVLPNDNGKFKPDYSLLMSGVFEVVPSSGSILDKYTNDFGSLDLSLISLTDLVPSSTLQPGLFSYTVRAEDNDNPYDDDSDASSIGSQVMGSSPENPGVAPGAILTIFQRTKDNSSHEVVFFDASNMFYGNRIKPGSYEIKDSAVTGSGGKVEITFKDNGSAGLYRADCATPHAKWAHAGNLLYDEGIAIIKTPNVPYFGREQFEVKLRGEQNIHVLEMNVPARAGMINSSSNPQYNFLTASDYVSDSNGGFVYITGMNFHDENMNVIARANLAQPVIKRDEDSYLFRVKVDF